MINLCMWTLVFVFSVTMFQTTYCYSGISRVFSGVDVTLIQEAVFVPPGLVDNSSNAPFFNMFRVKELVKTYLDDNLNPYLFGGSYSVSFLFEKYLPCYLFGRKSYSEPTKVCIKLLCRVLSTTVASHKTFVISKGQTHAS